MLEASRTGAIDTYTFYIRYYALLGLKRRAEAAAGPQLKSLLTTKTRDRRWEHERNILLAEYGGSADPVALLAQLSKAQEKIAADTQESKEKDDVRGARIIDDYPRPTQAPPKIPSSRKPGASPAKCRRKSPPWSPESPPDLSLNTGGPRLPTRPALPSQVLVAGTTSR